MTATDHEPDRSLPAWLRLLWAHVLFPGVHGLSTRCRLSALLILVIAPGLLLYPSMGFHLFEPDEGRYAQIPREMLERGEWIVPYLQGEPYLDKPPLLYWLVMLSYRCFGAAAWSARLIPALAVHACILVTYLLGRRSLGERPAFWGALLLALAPGFLSVGRLLVLDGLLTLWVSLALFGAFEALRGTRLHWGWWLLTATACGLGILTKGPIALILLVPPLVLYRWFNKFSPLSPGNPGERGRGEGEQDPVRKPDVSQGCIPPHPQPLSPGLPGERGEDAQRVFQEYRLLLSSTQVEPQRLSLKAISGFVSVLLLITLPWYVGICCKLPGFAGEFFWKHNVQRFLSPFDHLEPIWYYVPILLFGLLPGSLLLVPLLRFLLTSYAVQAGRRCPELGFMLLAGGWGVLFFTLSGCKLATYILPAFPFLALVLGYYLVQSGWHQSRWSFSIAACSFALLVLAHQLLLPWYAEFKSPMSRAEQVTHLCSDETIPIVCYPRSCDSAAFYLGRADFVTFRSKDTPGLIEFCKHRPRTVILFMHRHSMQTLRQVLPPGELAMTDVTPFFDSARSGMAGWRYLLGKSLLSDGTRDSKEGMCYMAVVQRPSR